jgi:hypothetical protein
MLLDVIAQTLMHWEAVLTLKLSYFIVSLIYQRQRKIPPVLRHTNSLGYSHAPLEGP